MLGSEILDVAIGLVLVYLLLSFVCSAIREAIEAVLKSRAVHLEAGIRELLHDPNGVGLAQALYNHPLIFGLYHGGYDPQKIVNGRMPARSSLPSYIPARNFALALLDIAARGPFLRDATAASTTVPQLTLENVRATVSHLDNPPVQRALLTAVDSARNGLADAQANLEAWYDSAMDRVSGGYKRKTHQILLVVGLIVTVVTNVDTLALANALYEDDELRANAVAVADRARTEPIANVEAAQARLDSLQLPVGWPLSERYTQMDSGVGWLRLGIGWLVTALAVSLGAPFWFDLLNRMMVIRSTVKPHEKSPEEGSEDRKAGAKRSIAAVLEDAPRATLPSKLPGPQQPPPSTHGLVVTHPAEPPRFQNQVWADGQPDEGVI